jgi:hypothetical protein
MIRERLVQQGIAGSERVTRKGSRRVLHVF